MSRCLVLAMVVLLVSSGVHEVHDAVDYVLEETGISSLVQTLKSGSLPQISLWDSLMCWWRSEELGTIRRRKKPVSRAVLKPRPKA